MEEKRNLKINFKQAKEMLESDNEMLKELAIGAFPELEKPKYPMSYLELVNSSDNRPRTASGNPVVIDEINGQLNDGIYFNSCLSKEQVKEVVAFIKLLALVKEWNKRDGFVPDWGSDTRKSVIRIFNNNICHDSSVYYSFPLVFKDDKTALLFHDAFQDLIEQCKNLI